MPEDVLARLRRIQGLAAKLEVHHAQIDEMMTLMVQDGLTAMPYGQYGGSIPDPTLNTAITRDSQAENDRAGYYERLDRIEADLEWMDTCRRRYMSANLDAMNREDPADYCVVHWTLKQIIGHRRVKGNLCSTCAPFYDENGREPTMTEADHYFRHGRWPHKLYDPKARKAV